MKNHKLHAFAIIFTILVYTKLYSQKDGETYYFQSAIAGKYMDVKWANPNNGTPLHLWTFNGKVAQKFKLEDAKDGYFYIKSALGKYIHIENESNKPKAHAVIWQGKGNNNTKWKFVNAGNGYHYVQSKLGTNLDVQWAKPEDGTPIWMWAPNNGKAQKWKLKPFINLSKLKMTAFKPKLHGFKFRNKFKSTVGDAGSIKFTLNGLCGGMAYAANDYFLSKLEIPKQNFQPSIGTKLHKYIFDRQQNSFANLDKFAEYTLNPFGIRDSEFFYWGLEGRLFELKKCIDRNQPIPLGLLNIHNDPTSHHQVLAIGYDLNGYTGKKEKDPCRNDVRIYIYDPNYPNNISALVPVSNKSHYKQVVGDIKNGKFIEQTESSKKWRSYFLDKRYKHKTPPRIKLPPKTYGTKINRLLVTIRTGGDDLRGGNDNVHLHIHFKDGTKQTILNINKKHRWPDNNNQTVEVYLNKPVYRNQIDFVKLQTTFGGGMFGDNWNMDSLNIIAVQGNGETHDFYSESGKPLKRFTGDHQWFSTK